MINEKLSKKAIIDIKINNHLKFVEEMQDIANSAMELINYYTMKYHEAMNKCKDAENKLNYEIMDLLDPIDFNETKTRFSAKLITGKFTIKKESKKIVIKNRDKLIKYLNDNKMNEYISTSQTLDWAEYKKHLHVSSDGSIVDSNGEIIEDCDFEVVPQRLELKI